jgi:hypothetical protein
MISVNKTGGKWQTFWVELFHLFNLLKLKHTPAPCTSTRNNYHGNLYHGIWYFIYNHLPGRSWSVFLNVDLVQVLLLEKK